MGSFITEKWLNINDLHNQHNLACFNIIILYCYFIVRTVRIKVINRLISKKIVQWFDLEWLQNIGTYKADKWSFDNIYHILLVIDQSYITEITVRNNFK